MVEFVPDFAAIDWKGPVIAGGAGSARENGFPPSIVTSLQTSFFMPSAGGTHGPPVSDHPGEEAMASSMPSRSASRAAALNADFQAGVM